MQINWVNIFIETVYKLVQSKEFILFLTISIILIFIKYILLKNSKLSDIDRMSGQDFENKLQQIFISKGYLVTHTGKLGDYGVDLVIEKDGIKTAIQAKRHKSKIGIDAVQQVTAGKLKYNCENAMVVTNRYFTYQAKQLAAVNNLELWDRNKLSNLLK
jgi:restriction system protein